MHVVCSLWNECWFVLFSIYVTTQVCISGDCVAGEGLDPADNTACATCPTGSYSDVTGPVECTACPEGRTTASTGSSAEEQCVGEYHNTIRSFRSSKCTHSDKLRSLAHYQIQFQIN